MCHLLHALWLYCKKDSVTRVFFEWKDYKDFRTLDIKLMYYVLMLLVETRTSFIMKDTP